MPSLLPPPSVCSKSDKPPAHVLKAPIVVVTPVGEFEHERGALVLGRAEDSNIVIEDPLDFTRPRPLVRAGR
ncbi:MAG: hypothetical protein QM756_04100 [Polyangiaceae bacterium]